MLAVFCHLWGDYIFQSNWMANNKTKNSGAALAHALTFLLLHPSLWAWLVIVTTHYFIDRYRLARYVAYAKNWVNEPKMKWSDCQGTGYPSETPAWLAVWLMIITDNILHLTINYLALTYL